MQQEQAGSGLLKFYSREALKAYLRKLMESYRAGIEAYAELLGPLFRDEAQAKQARAASRGWMRLGPLLYNASETDRAVAEVMLQLMEELKAKLARTEEALRALEDPANTALPERGHFLLCMRQGVPERLILDMRERQVEPFAFAASFRLVEA